MNHLIIYHVLLLLKNPAFDLATIVVHRVIGYYKEVSEVPSNFVVVGGGGDGSGCDVTRTYVTLLDKCLEHEGCCDVTSIIYSCSSLINVIIIIITTYEEQLTNLFWIFADFFLFRFAFFPSVSSRLLV